MDDMTLTTRLVGDASSLNAALAQGERGVKSFGDEAAQAASRQAAAARTAGAALAEQQRAMRAARAEANLLANANRQLPMQMTDIVTSIASGMPVWMVAIQQGGQLRDSYGGVLPAGRAMAGMFNATTLAAGGAAVGVGALIAAHYAGRAEADAYARAIVMSGNAAGGTIGQYTAAAEALDRVVGTQARAAEVIAALAGTGRVAAGSVDLVAEAVVRMERDLSIATDEAVGMFAALGKEPVQASAKLNEQFRHMTASVYDQIKALKDQGREAEAAALAQQTFAQAMSGRATELEARLGTLQRAWRGVKDFASEAWDAMLGLGRQQTPEQEMAAIEAALATPLRRGGDPARAEAGRAAARQRLEELRLQVYQEREAASAGATSAAATEQHIKTEKDRAAVAKAAADAYRTLAQDLARDVELMQAELVAGGQLSEVRRQEIQALQQIEAKRSIIGSQRADELRAVVAGRTELAQQLDLERQVAAQRAQATAAGLQAARQGQRQLEAETQQMADRNAALLEETQTMGLSTRALIAVEQARISSALAIKEEHLARLQASGAYSAENENLVRQIELLRNRQLLLGIKTDRATELEGEAEAERRRKQDEDDKSRRREAVRESIDQGIMEGLRDGKSQTEVFWRELKAQAARTILSPIIRPLADAGAGLLEQIIGGIVGLAGGGSTDGAGDMSNPGDTGPPGPRAGGGRMEPYGDYWVGELGPERVRMGGRGGYVYPTHASGAGTRGGGQAAPVQHLQIHVDARSDRADVFSTIAQAVEAGNAKLLDMMQRRET